MSDKNTRANGYRTRRGLLRTAAVTLAGLVGTAGTGVAGSKPDENGPASFETTVIKRVIPDGDHFRLEKRAVSPAFKERFGGPVLTYEPEPIPRASVPEEYADSGEPFTVQYRDEIVVGTLNEHVEAERAARDEQRKGSVETASHAQNYDGPKYVYESASGAEDEDVYERTAPINVAWGTSIDKSASQLQSYMENRGWEEHWTMPGSGTRYILYDGQAHGQDEHVYQEIYYTRQWHIRVYDVSVDSSAESLQVIGNAHRDPLDHNHIGDEPWYFDDARNEATSDWESWGHSRGYISTDDTTWETHDGNVGVVTA